MVTLVRGAEEVAARIGPRLLPAKARALADNLDRVVTSDVSPLVSPRALAPRSALAAPPAADPAKRSPTPLVESGFGSYGRYWAESFRLPYLDSTKIDRGFSFLGNEHIERVRSKGLGPIVVLPHLGGWEWAAAWLATVNGIGVTAVVERLEPPEVFEWFQDLRRRYGVNVVPLGPGAMSELVAAVHRCDIVCLPADRDIGGTGVPIEFFGATTSMPVGPAVLARRTGAPILPTGVMFRGRQRVAVVTEPIWPQGRGRAENLRLTRAAAARMEQLIVSAPDQWHVLEPMWSPRRSARSRFR